MPHGRVNVGLYQDCITFQRSKKKDFISVFPHVLRSLSIRSTQNLNTRSSYRNATNLECIMCFTVLMT